MPIYPALALLLGSAMETGNVWVSRGTRVLCLIAGVAAAACFLLIFQVRNLPTPGDISSALSQHPGAYTLALGHMLDLTINSFAYLRWPLALAGIAFLVGALGTFRFNGFRAAMTISFMMVLLFQAARLAMVTFDPFLSSRPLANAILRSPQGRLIMGDQYYTYSSIFFYTNQDALLLNGRYFNLEYGSNAPGAAPVFIGDVDFKQLWDKPDRYYVVADHAQLPHFKSLLGTERLNIVATGGGKLLLTSQPLDHPAILSDPKNVAEHGH